MGTGQDRNTNKQALMLQGNWLVTISDSFCSTLPEVKTVSLVLMLFFSVLNLSYTIQQKIFLSAFSNAHLLVTEYPCLDCLQPSFMVLGVNRKLQTVYSSSPSIYSSVWLSFPYTFVYLLYYFFWCCVCVCVCMSIYVACIYMWSLCGVCVWFICRVCV